MILNPDPYLKNVLFLFCPMTCIVHAKIVLIYKIRKILVLDGVNSKSIVVNGLLAYIEDFSRKMYIQLKV